MHSLHRWFSHPKRQQQQAAEQMLTDAVVVQHHTWAACSLDIWSWEEGRATVAGPSSARTCSLTMSRASAVWMPSVSECSVDGSSARGSGRGIMSTPRSMNFSSTLTYMRSSRLMRVSLACIWCSRLRMPAPSRWHTGMRDSVLQYLQSNRQWCTPQQRLGVQNAG